MLSFDQRARRTWRFVLGVALLTAALLLLTACGGDTGRSYIGSSDTGSGGTGSDGTRSGGTGSSDTGSGGTVRLRGSTETTTPVSPGCQPPDMENCYGYGDMQAYLDQIIPLVEQFFATTYTDMPHPAEYIYVPEGETGPTGCTDGYTDEAYFYCPADQSIYTGQRSLWGYYSNLGDAAPAVGFAHEWGHHLQVVASVPPAQTTVGQISRENQADCIAGAWVAYADEQGWLNYPDDLHDIDGLLAAIASDEPGRSHGDLGERTDSLLLGFEAGMQGCNDFFPDSPVITTSSPSPSPATTQYTTTSTTP